MRPFFDFMWWFLKRFSKSYSKRETTKIAGWTHRVNESSQGVAAFDGEGEIFFRAEMDVQARGEMAAQS